MCVLGGVDFLFTVKHPTNTHLSEPKPQHPLALLDPLRRLHVLHQLQNEIPLPLPLQAVGHPPNGASEAV